MIHSNKQLKIYLDAQLQELRQRLINQPTLEILWYGHDPASKTYVGIKSKLAEKYGIAVEVIRLEEGFDLLMLESQLGQSSAGRIVQLPIPQNAQHLLKLLPAAQDVDCLLPTTQYNMHILPPTIQAINLMLQDMLGMKVMLGHIPDLSHQTVCVVGQGLLVGAPLLDYLKQSGASIISLNKHTHNPELLCRQADIVITAAGVPRLINNSWLKSSALVIDAATSESDGTLVGDVDPNDISDTILFSPSPGGIGPLTVRCLFYNTLLLAQKAQFNKLA
jgi:methylenetetrahydrofolate dehydrogenase (NADP+) / methenyltetrahydrofolate cyclohydrolase